MENKNTENSKSAKSGKSSRKKSDISPTTIIASIEREVSDLIQEISIRSQKNKLISINESLKLLNKRIASGGSTSDHHQKEKDNDYNMPSYQRQISYNEELHKMQEINIKLKEEIETIVRQSDVEIKKLREEIKDLQNKISNSSIINEGDNKLAKKDEIINKLNQKLEQVNYMHQEERSRNNNFLLQIKNLEEALKTLNIEYNNITIKFAKTQSESEFYEKTISDLRRNLSENKIKFEELCKINQDLKTKLIENENVLKLHLEDLKSSLRKNASLQKQIEAFENDNKNMYQELSYKEERLKAVRFMNTKLEQKSNQILKKFEAFRLFEEKTQEVTSNSHRMLEVIEELNKKLNLESNENDSLKKQLEMRSNETSKYIKDLDEMRKQIFTLKQMNEELVNKNNELENKFKRSLEQRAGIESKENSFIQGNRTNLVTGDIKPSKGGFHSNALNNLSMSSKNMTTTEQIVKFYNYLFIEDE
jgi:hypothetical protein